MFIDASPAKEETTEGSEPNGDSEKQGLTDEEIMEMIQRKEADGLGLLHNKYGNLLKGIAINVLHNESESEDLLQEVLVEVWKRAATFDRGKGKPLGWIITLTHRRAIDRLRKQDAYLRMERRAQEAGVSNSQTGFDQVEGEVAHGEMREQLRRVMASLPSPQRQALEMAYYQGLSQRGIAEATGIPLGTIKTRLELGIRKLGAALRGFEDLL